MNSCRLYALCMLAVSLYLGSYETFYVLWLREVRENACNLSTFRNPNSFLYQFSLPGFASKCFTACSNIVYLAVGNVDIPSVFVNMVHMGAMHGKPTSILPVDNGRLVKNDKANSSTSNSCLR